MPLLPPRDQHALALEALASPHLPTPGDDELALDDPVAHAGRRVEEVHAAADVQRDHLEPVADLEAAAGILPPPARARDVPDAVFLREELQREVRPRPATSPLPGTAGRRPRRRRGSSLPASITNRSRHGSATTVARTRAAHVASVADPSRICWTSLKTYVPGRISLTPAAAATILAVGVEPTLISRISMPPRSQGSAVARSSPASRSAIDSSSPGRPGTRGRRG